MSQMDVKQIFKYSLDNPPSTITAFFLKKDLFNLAIICARTILQVNKTSILSNIYTFIFLHACFARVFLVQFACNTADLQNR